MSNKTSDIDPFYQSSVIRRDLLKRSKDKAERRSKPVFKVRGKSAKILEREIVKVKVKFGAKKAGYSFCCNKPQCVFCGEATLKFRLFHHQEQYSRPRIYKPKEGLNQTFIVCHQESQPANYSYKLKSWKELEYQDQIRAQEEHEENLREVRAAREWSFKWIEKRAEKQAEVARELAREGKFN
jgi:hypothetical protein